MLSLGSERTQVFRVSYAEYKKYLSDCETVRGSYIGAKPNYQEVSTIEVIVPQMTQNVTSKVSANEVMCYYVDGKRVRRERVAYAIQNGLVQEKITDTNERSRREKLNEELHAGEWILTSCKNKNGTLSYLINGVKILKDELILNVEYYYHGEWKNCREVKADSGVRELLTSDRRSLFSGKELDWKTMKYVSCASYLDGKITWLDETDEQVEEIDASEYAVSVEAQEVAVGAEIENAASAAEKCDKKFSKERCEMTMEIKASAVSAEIESASIEFDAAKMAQEETAVNAELNEWVAEMVAAMKAELAETEAALKKLEAEIAANGATEERVAKKAEYEAEISEMKRNLENYVVTESAAEADVEDYAVSVEAQEVAVETAIENAANTKVKKFEEGKSYKCGDENYKVVARGEKYVAFEAEGGQIFSLEIREDFIAEYVYFYGVDISATDEIACEEVSAEVEMESAAQEDWERESNEILEKTVYAALKNGNAIKLFAQGYKAADEPAELRNCYKLTAKDAEIPRTFCSDMYEEGGEVTFTPVSPKGVSYSLADYKTKEQFQAVATKLAEAIKRGDKQFVFPTIEELETQEVSGSAEMESAANANLFVVKVSLENGEIEEYEVPSLHWACNSMRGAREYYKENYELEIIGDKTGRIYYKVDSAGKVVIDEIDWAEYANAEMIHSIGEYAVDADAAAEVEELNAAAQPTMLDKLKAKVAEQKNRLKKSVIDWAGTLKDYAKKDFYILQNDLKRFIELGEIELAAKTFETIKEKYRTLYAA